MDILSQNDFQNQSGLTLLTNYPLIVYNLVIAQLHLEVSMTSFPTLFQSREFWLLVLDGVVSLTLHFFGGDDVNFIIGAIQPIFLFVIYHFTQVEKAAYAAGVHPACLDAERVRAEREALSK